MKTKITALLAVLFLSISATAQIDRSVQPKPGPAPTITLEVPGEFQLKNGLKVLVVENHKLPRVSYSLTIDNKPIVEGDKAGVSSMLGAMLGNGTTSISKDDFNDEIDFLGARLNFGSSSAYASGLSKYSERIMELMADAAINPLLTQEEFDKEKTKVLEGLKNSEKSVSAVAGRVGSALAYGKKHPYGEFVTEETVNNITLDNVRAFYQKYFNPNNAYLVIVGDVDFKTVEKNVKKYFKNWEKGIDFTTNIIEPNPNVPTTQINFVDMPNAVQSNIAVTNNVDLKMNDDDYLAAKVANYILGGGGDGYLFLNLREDKAYTYGSYSSVGADKYGASRFEATAEVRNMVTDSSIVEILKEVNRIKNETITEEALKNAKAKYVGSFIMSLEQPQTIARNALNIKLNNLPTDYYKTYLSRINALTVQDIKDAANKYFKPQNARVVVVGKGSEVIPNLEKTGLPIKYFDKFANPVEKPVFSKPIPDGVTVKTVVDNYITAIGGLDNIKAVKTVHMSGDVKIEGVPIPLTAEVKYMMPNKESLEMNAEGMGTLMKQKWNGTTGYMEQQGMKRDMTEDQIAEKKASPALFPETDFDMSNVSLESVVSINGEDHYKVKVVNGDNEIFRYYNTSTNYLTQVESTTEAQGQEIKTVVTYNNYSPVNGVQIPYSQTIVSGPQTIAMNFKAIKVNEGVTDADFE